MRDTWIEVTQGNRRVVVLVERREATIPVGLRFLATAEILRALVAAGIQFTRHGTANDRT